MCHRFLRLRLCHAQHSLTACGAIVLLAGLSTGEPLPDGPGKAATVRVCGRCHSPERAATLHQSRSAWEDTITKMVKLGAQGSDDEFEAVLNYLSKNFAKEIPGPVNMNKATAVDLESTLVLRRSQAKAIIEYRNEHGDFRSFDDLRNVPGINIAQLETKKARIVF